MIAESHHQGGAREEGVAFVGAPLQEDQAGQRIGALHSCRWSSDGEKVCMYLFVSSL